MKKLFITLAVVFIYLFVSIFTGWWAITWVIWVFYFVYMVADMYKNQ